MKIAINRTPYFQNLAFGLIRPDMFDLFRASLGHYTVLRQCNIDGVLGSEFIVVLIWHYFIYLRSTSPGFVGQPGILRHINVSNSAD